MPRDTRSSQSKFDPELNKDELMEIKFTAIDKWDPKKLPTYKEVLGKTIFLNGNENLSWNDAIVQVSRDFESWWIKRNIYTVSFNSIKEKVDALIGDYRKLNRSKKTRICIFYSFQGPRREK